MGFRERLGQVTVMRKNLLKSDAILSLTELFQGRAVYRLRMQAERARTPAVLSSAALLGFIQHE